MCKGAAIEGAGGEDGGLQVVRPGVGAGVGMGIVVMLTRGASAAS